MATTSRRSPLRNVLYTFIMLAIFFLLIELVLSVFLYHRHSSERLASIEVLRSVKRSFQTPPSPVNVTNQNLVRPDSSEAVNRQIAEETHQSNKFIYEPWIEFRNIDFNGRFVNVNKSVRLSVPSVVPSPSTDTIDIYFLGGSTMFGFNVSDAETIPSQFMRVLEQSRETNSVIRATNFGTPTYYSGQELVLLSQLLLNGHKPDVVIFLDGVNDFWFARASYYNQSYFSFLFRQVLSPTSGVGGAIQLRDSSDKMYLTPEGLNEEEFNQTLIRNYYSNMRKAMSLAEGKGIDMFFFCQPVPFYKYPRQQQDPICFKDQNTRYNSIYPMIEKDASTLPNFTFLGNMLEQEQGYPFVDGLHYSPAFNKKVAERIYQTVAGSAGWKKTN